MVVVLVTIPESTSKKSYSNNFGKLKKLLNPYRSKRFSESNTIEFDVDEKRLVFLKVGGSLDGYEISRKTPTDWGAQSVPASPAAGATGWSAPG